MDIVPSIRVARFEQLEPGEFFVCLDERQKFYALKTQKPSGEDRCFMVLLGPTFTEEIKGPWLAPWRAVTVLSFGKNFSIVPSLDAASWSSHEPNPSQVCIAVVDQNVYICANGAQWPSQHFPCFVDVRTGEIFESRPPGIAAYTNVWEIAVLGTNHPPRTILRFPTV
jgi:hypothetical protein